MLARITRTSLREFVRCARPYGTQSDVILADVSELEEGDYLTEKEYSSAIIHGRGIYEPLYHPQTHGVPVALLHFRGFVPERMDLYLHFVAHAAAALEIPISKPVHLPSKRSMWTVLKGPFVHKKKQENFERIVHKRAIKAWDADAQVMDRWLKYIRLHAVGGIGLRVTRWERAAVGFGERQLGEVTKQLVRSGRVSATRAEQVKELGAQIVARELSTPSTIHTDLSALGFKP